MNKKKHIDGYLEVTHKCNQNCAFCSFPPKNDGMSFKELKEKVMRFKEKNVSEIVLTGGEPTINPDLPKLIKLISDQGLPSRLITNGVKLADKCFVKKLIDSGLGRVALSFHTHKKDISEKLSGVPGNFEKYILAMENMTELKLWFDINTTITSLNLPYLPDTVKFIAANFPKTAFISFNFVDAVGNSKNNFAIVPKISSAEYHLTKIFHACKNCGIEFHIERVPLCYMHYFETRSSEAHKFINDEFILISRKEKDFNPVRHKPGAKINGYTKSEPCKICLLNDICAGLPEDYAEMYGTGELYPRFKSIQSVLAQETNRKFVKENQQWQKSQTENTLL